MKIIKPSYEILTPIDGVDKLQQIEKCARVCYKSEDKITDDGESAKKIVRALIKSGHEAMLEHSFLSVKFIVDRGVSHEIVRHRLFSFAQESTRYCNYTKDKFGNEITFIKPFFFTDDREDKSLFAEWMQACSDAEKAYLKLIDKGAKAQEARTVLPNSVKTEIVVSGNYREWRHFFRLRTASDAHPQMREVTIPLLRELQNSIPVIFDDIVFSEG